MWTLMGVGKVSGGRWLVPQKNGQEDRDFASLGRTLNWRMSNRSRLTLHLDSARLDDWYCIKSAEVFAFGELGLHPTVSAAKEGRDFFNQEPPAGYYKPYVYPHPLQEGWEG